MRRSVALAVMALLIVALLTSCHPIIESEADPISVYASFYPIYALTEAVVRDVPDVSLHLLVQPQDGCLRSYQLSDWDLYLLSGGADAVIMGGRGLESFESALFAWGDEGPACAAVLYNLELYNQDQAVTDGESESHNRGANPHLYMSVEGAKMMIESISASMQSLDPMYADLYVKNAQSTVEQLNALLEVSREQLSTLNDRRVVLMNEALIYPALDYDLTVAEQLDRESGEALYDTALENCLKRFEDSGARVVLIEKQAPQAFVEAIEAAGFAAARLDIFSTHREGEGFDSYIEIQRSNVQAIREAFERVENREVAN